MMNHRDTEFTERLSAATKSVTQRTRRLAEVKLKNKEDNGDWGDQKIRQAAGRQRRVFRNIFLESNLKKRSRTGTHLVRLLSQKSISEDASAPAACRGIPTSAVSPLSPHSFFIPGFRSVLSVSLVN